MHRTIKHLARGKLLLLLSLFFGYLCGFGVAISLGILRGARLHEADFAAVWLVAGLAGFIGIGTLLIGMHDLSGEFRVKK